ARRRGPRAARGRGFVGAGSSRHFSVRADRPKGVYSDAMPRACVWTSTSQAVGRLRPGMKVLLPPGCGEPQALVAEVCRQAERLRDLTLMGGVHLGDYPWARPEQAALRCAMWHMSPRLEDARRRGRVEFLPLRYFDAVAAISAGGAWAPDCVLIQTAPPDAGGSLHPERTV